MNGLSFGAIVRTATILATVLFAGATVMLALAARPASAEQSRIWQWCVNSGSAYSLDQEIEGCTDVIQSGRETQNNKASAYNNRGNAYKA